MHDTPPGMTMLDSRCFIDHARPSSLYPAAIALLMFVSMAPARTALHRIPFFL